MTIDEILIEILNEYRHAVWDAEDCKKLKAALAAADYFICRMSGGVHEGHCPLCGCEPHL